MDLPFEQVVEHQDILATPFSFRPATQGDAPAIWELISSVLKEHGILPDLHTTDLDLADIQANYWDQAGIFLVLLNNRQIIGTVALRRITDTTCELCRMYLKPKYREQGLGHFLMQQGMFLAKEKGFHEIQLKTAAVLKTAIRLYERSGFVRDEKATCCGNCNVTMRKRLSTAI